MNKLWEEDFKGRAESIPKNRRADTIRSLRDLIKDMYQAHFGVAEIGRLLGKDHSTIVHHLFLLGFKPRIEAQQLRISSGYADWKLQEEKRKAANRIERNKHQKEIADLRDVRSQAYADERLKTKRDKEIARKLYNSGLPLLEIARKIGCSVQRVNYLIHYDDKKDGVMTRRPNASITIQQFDLAGNLLATFRSISSASKETGIIANSITHAIRDGRYKTGGGFVWKILNNSAQ